jgi:hypothetical protein
MDQMINRLELGKHILQKQAGQPIPQSESF